MSEALAGGPTVLREFQEPHIRDFLDWHATAPGWAKHDTAIRCGAGVHVWSDEPPVPNTALRRWCFACGTVQEIAR